MLNADGKLDVLHVTYTYFPDPSGGTEVYVRGLAQELRANGHATAIAAPASATAAYMESGLQVYRFRGNSAARVDLAYGAIDEIAAENFKTIVEKTRPRIVHLHARTAAVSERLIDVAHAAGATVIFTYHSPTASCVRGTMMLFGEAPCDGRIDTTRCTACAVSALGVARPMARLLAAAPGLLSTLATTLKCNSKPLSTLRIPGLIISDQQRFLQFIEKIDHVVAVSQWVNDVLTRNAVPADKITLSRQGIDMSERPARRDLSRGRTGALKIGYFGRIGWAKGPDLLARALSMIPLVDVEVDVFAIRPASGSDRDYEWLARQAQKDHRLRLRAAVAPEKVLSTMAEYDLIAVPSRWLETGPLVALEAFAAGVPVIGADIGGIPEVVRNGSDSILLPSDDPEAWAEAIRGLAENRGGINRLRAQIRPPRTMADAASDMIKLYSEIAPRRLQ
jgi:glycosyltransferase involved in cell wall biosynthesis